MDDPEIPDLVERLVRRFLADRAPGETFSTWVRDADEESLR